MTLRTSNERALAVLPPLPVEGIGWTVRFLSETDYETVLAHTNRWAEATFSDELNEVGAFSLTMAVDDPVFTTALPNGEPGDILGRECIVQFLYEGVVRFEGLLEDVVPQEVAPDGTPMVTLSGRGIAALIERAIALPDGMPVPVTFAREFTGASMAAWLTLFTEAQGRGIAQKITPTFSATNDSYSEAWGEDALRTVQAGTDLLSLLNTFCETNDYVWTVSNPYRKLVVAKNYGQHLAADVIFYQGRHLLESERKATRREIKTVVFAQAGDFALASASGNVSRWGRREKWVTAGGAGDISTAQSVATAEARISGDEKISRTARVLFAEAPGRRPFEDYRVGDWVGVEAEGGEIAEVRIMAMALRLDDAGNADSEITLQTRFESEEIRVRRQLERLNASGLTDAGGQPITILQTVQATVSLSDLRNVAPVAAADGDVLTWDAATSQWVPDAPAGGGGGGAAIEDRRWVAEVPNTANDEFRDGTIAVDWLRVDVGGGASRATWTEGGDSLSLVLTGGDPAESLHGFVKPHALAVGEYVQAHFEGFGVASNYPSIALVVSDGTTYGSGEQMLWGFHSGALRNLFAYKFSNWANYGGGATAGFSGAAAHFRLKRVASDQWACMYSADGVEWVTYSTQTKTLTPTHVGFATSTWGGADAYSFSADYFRIGS